MVSKGKKRNASAPAQGAPPAKKQKEEEKKPEEDILEVAELADLIASDPSKDASLLKAVTPLGTGIMGWEEGELKAFCRPMPTDVAAMLEDDPEDQEDVPPMEVRLEQVAAALYGADRTLIIGELQGSVVPNGVDEDGDGGFQPQDLDNLPPEMKAALEKMMAGAGEGADSDSDGKEDGEAADGGETKLEGEGDSEDSEGDCGDCGSDEEGGMFWEIDPNEISDEVKSGFFKKGDAEEDEEKAKGPVTALIKGLAKHSANGKVYKYIYPAITFEDDDEASQAAIADMTEEVKEFQKKAVARSKEFLGAVLSDTKFPEQMVVGYVVVTKNNNYLGLETGVPMPDGDSEDEDGAAVVG